jgi:4-hydroxybenzoyl-CoA thioesterase
MVDTRAKFYIPSTHGDRITIESRTDRFKSSSFEVTHKVFKDERLGIEGSRLACWSPAIPMIPIA